MNLWWDDQREEREEGFSLVELLVVIVIIGILSAIAIGAFVNQRKKANDAALQDSMRQFVNIVETAKVDYPNAPHMTAYYYPSRYENGKVLEGEVTATFYKKKPGAAADRLGEHKQKLVDGTRDYRNVNTGAQMTLSSTGMGEYVITGCHRAGKAYACSSTRTQTDKIAAQYNQDRQAVVDKYRTKVDQWKTMKDFQRRMDPEFELFSKEYNSYYIDYRIALAGGKSLIFDSKVGKMEEVKRSDAHENMRETYAAKTTPHDVAWLKM